MPATGGTGLGPTRISTLVGVAVLTAAVTYVLVSSAYGSLPPLSLVVLVTPGILAVVLALLARTTRDRIAQERSVASLRPVEPITIARYAALAKASAVAGAVGVGAWTGFLLSVVDDVRRLEAARGDAVVSGLGVVLSVALVAAALWLEHSCRIPPPKDEDTAAARHA